MKNISLALLHFMILINCSSIKTKSFTNIAPFVISAPYYNSWTAGTEQGGSGTDVILPVLNLRNIMVDSIHFRGQKSKAIRDGNLIIGQFKLTTIKSKDLIMSSNIRDEFQNKLVNKADLSPFILAENECVISYSLQSKRHYHKISDLKKERHIAYPSAPPKKH